jgi:hypothetical protein
LGKVAGPSSHFRREYLGHSRRKLVKIEAEPIARETNEKNKSKRREFYEVFISKVELVCAKIP